MRQAIVSIFAQDEPGKRELPERCCIKLLQPPLINYPQFGILCDLILKMSGAALPALPVVPPSNWEDFSRCDIRYGFGIQAADCQAAAVDLAQGPSAATYYTTEGHVEALTLPWSRTVGTCKLMVELAGPAALDLHTIQLVPDQVRGMAGYVIRQCSGGGDQDSNLGNVIAGLGGYVTAGLERVYNWMEQSTQFFLVPLRCA